MLSGSVGKTAFTIMALVLSVVLVRWNHHSASYEQTGRKLLAGGAISAENLLPINIILGKDRVTLGDEQTITVSTSPKARIVLTIIYDGGQDRDKEVITGVSDKAGYLVKRLKTDDWHRLGPVRIIAVATDNAGMGETSRSYYLVADDQAPVVDEPSYFCPIVP